MQCDINESGVMAPILKWRNGSPVFWRNGSPTFWRNGSPNYLFGVMAPAYTCTIHMHCNMHKIGVMAPQNGVMAPQHIWRNGSPKWRNGSRHLISLCPQLLCNT